MNKKELEKYEKELKKEFELCSLYIDRKGWKKGFEKGKEQLYISIGFSETDKISYYLHKDKSYMIKKAEFITSDHMNTIKIINNKLKDKQ